MRRPPSCVSLFVAAALLVAVLPRTTAQPIDATTKESLLAQTVAIRNWQQFRQNNNLNGWDFEVATTKAGFVHYCNWTGISCVNLAVTALELPCDTVGGGYCSVLAEGTLAPELANISSLVALDLSGQQLTGALPASYSGLSKLTRLLLPWNRFNGSIPPSWAEGGAFPQLETLDLANNRLTGSLPPAPNGTGLLPSLVTLQLSNNTLTSTLPASWGSSAALPKLELLSLGQNQLNGSLPAEWASPGAFSSLTQLDMMDNRILGPLPGNWGGAQAFPALGELNLGGNQLEGTLPEAWACCGGFPQLYSLFLASNNLSGTLPASWAPPAFPSLGGLQLGGNPRLCGPVPDALYPAVCSGPSADAATCVGRELPACNADFLPASDADVAALLAQSAAISNWAEFAAQNSINGWNVSTPACQWTGVTCTPQGSVIALDLGCESRGYEGEVLANCNGLAQGTLAPELAGISTLQQLVLRNQQLAGTLPSGWGNSSAFANLNDLQLEGNRLTGSIPTAWATDGAFPKLLILTLQQNQLGGALPPQLGQAGSLPAVTFLDFSSNRLSGTLPASWAGMELLRQLNLTNNIFTGTLPEPWGLDGGMPALSELYISLNRLGGQLPPAWGDAPSFANLRVIELASNSINGTLPPTYGSNGSLPVIGAIFLENNMLSGSLPAEWGSPDAFQQLNQLILDGNRLSGSIPPSWNDTGSFSSLAALSLNGNPGLCDSAVPALLQPAVCDSQATNCSNGQISCQPAESLPPLIDSNEGSSGAGSSAPVGAIVGGVVGGLVLLAVVALLVVGSRRGWLFGSSLRKQRSTASRRGEFTGLEDGNAKLVPGMDPGTLSLLPADAQDDAALAMLPHSYVSTMGRNGAAGTARAQRATWAPPVGDTASGSPSLHSLDSDPVITFISTRMGTLSRRRSSMLPTSDEGPSADSPSGNTPSADTPSARPPSTNEGSQPTADSENTGHASLTADMQLWAVRWEQIQLDRAIGRGSFGRVYLATWNATPTAVKVLISADDLEQRQDLELPPAIMRELQEEAIVMSRMRHPNIVSFFGLCTLPPCILTEYCSRGSVFDVLRQASWDAELAGQLTWRLRLSMAYDAARGLLYLHMREPLIVHSDVKSPNLLVDEHWHVKVADFNLSQILAGQQQGGPTMDEGGATNPMWLAPELLSLNTATTASDAYAMGLVMFELLTWRLPFVGLSPYQIRRKVLDGGRPELPPLEELPGPDNDTFVAFGTYCQLMRDCWAQDPRRRPPFSEIVARLGAMLQ